VIGDYGVYPGDRHLGFRYCNIYFLAAFRRRFGQWFSLNYGFTPFALVLPSNFLLVHLRTGSARYHLRPLL